VGKGSWPVAWRSAARTPSGNASARSGGGGEQEERKRMCGDWGICVEAARVSPWDVLYIWRGEKQINGQDLMRGASNGR
jgi:hypothetical protein